MCHRATRPHRVSCRRAPVHRNSRSTRSHLATLPGRTTNRHFLADIFRMTLPGSAAGRRRAIVQRQASFASGVFALFPGVGGGSGRFDRTGGGRAICGRDGHTTPGRYFGRAGRGRPARRPDATGGRQTWRFNGTGGGRGRVPLAACCQCGVRHGRTSRPWHPTFIESALTVRGTAGLFAGETATPPRAAAVGDRGQA